jgi:hypothetical protein
MSSVNHQTVPVLVWADIDIGIAEHVRWLNSLPGVRTFTSCQGTIGEGGPHPYEPYVVAWWPPELDDVIKTRFELGSRENIPVGWHDLRPKRAR